MFEREGRRPPTGPRERLPAGLKSLSSAIGDLRTAEGRARLASATRETCFRVADDTVRAISAGLGIADVRALFRGEPPVEKPSRRDSIFANAFFAHMRPRYYERSAAKFSNTFGLGFLSVFFAIVEGITGIILMIFYNPTLDGAYASVTKIVGQVPFGQFIRDIHRVGAELLVLVVGLHLLRVFLAGSFKHPRQFTWVTGVILLAITLAFAFTGYLLPFDQSALWGINLVTDVVKSAPPREIVGNALSLLLRGGDAIGQSTLLRFYLGHVALLPVLAILILAVHYYRVSRLHGISLPASEEESPDPEVRRAAKERVDYLPDIFTKELMWVSVGVFAIIAFAAYAFNAPLGRQADPLHAPLHTTAPWYLLWLQGMLKDPILLPILRGLQDIVGIDLLQLYDSTAVQGIIFPMLFFLILLGVPYIDEFWDRFRGRPSSRLGHNRKLGITLGLLAVVLWVLFTFFGTSMFGVSASPAVEISQAFIPPECVPSPIPLISEDCGEVRRLGYDGLPVGAYDLSQFATVPANADRFQVMLTQMQSRLQQQAELARQSPGAGLPDARGFFVVADWQTDLKKVTLRVIWTPREPGKPGAFERTIYLHRDSAYR